MSLQLYMQSFLIQLISDIYFNMKTITKSVIKLSEIPEELHQYIVAGFDVHTGHNVHSYLEFHIGDNEDDDLTLWLLKNYPTLKRKISFLIHIDI